MRRLDSTIEADATLWPADNPNYPGVPQRPDIIARSTSRATVDYETYVLAYAAQQRGHVLLMTAGIVLIIGAAFYLSPPWLIIAAALGLGLTFGGAAGFTTAWDAHRSYTRDLAVSISETYERPAPRPQPATVRPFVPSGNNAATTNTGRLNFTPQVWRDLFDLALENSGVITRDRVQRAGVGRRWYHGEGWDRLKEELTRLGFIDSRNRLTPAARAWYANAIPLPLAALPTRSHLERTNGERTANERPADAAGWGEQGES